LEPLPAPSVKFVPLALEPVVLPLPFVVFVLVKAEPWLAFAPPAM